MCLSGSSSAHSPFPAAWETHSLNSSLMYSPCGSDSCGLQTHLDSSLAFCSFLAFFHHAPRRLTYYTISQFLPAILQLTFHSTSPGNLQKHTCTVFHYMTPSLFFHGLRFYHLDLSTNQWSRLVNLISKFSQIIDCCFCKQTCSATCPSHHFLTPKKSFVL